MLINVEFFSLWQHKKRNSMICMMNDSKAFLVRNVKYFASWMVMNWRSTGKWQNNLRYVIWVISFHRHFSSKLIKAHCEPRFQHSIKENIFSAENCMSAASFCNLIICQTKWKQPFFMFDSSTINRSLPTTRNVVAQAMNCIGSNNERRKRKDCDEFSDSICYLFIYERMSLFQFNMLHGCVLIVSTQCFGLFVPKRIDRAFHG